jgi:hypothetical protein
MLGHSRQNLGREAGDHHGERTANNDQNTGRVKEVDQIFEIDLQDLGRVEIDFRDHAEQHNHNGNQHADNI